MYLISFDFICMITMSHQQGEIQGSFFDGFINNFVRMVVLKKKNMCFLHRPIFFLPAAAGYNYNYNYNYN